MFSNTSQLITTLKYSLQQSNKQGHRLLLVLAGNDAVKQAAAIQETFTQYASDVVQDSDSSKSGLATQLTSQIVLVPDRYSNTDLSDQINKFLGSENSCVFFDASGVFDARLMAASLGTVVAGGLIIILTPALQEWLPTENNQVKSRSQFLARFANTLVSHQTQCIYLSSNEPHSTALFVGGEVGGKIDSNSLDQTATSNEANANPKSWKTEQDALLKEIVNRLSQPVESGHQDAIVVQGDRGRGKSALVGRAIRHYLLTPAPAKITLCASRQSVCTVLQKHTESQIEFASIQQALEQQHDLLLIEEAGSIPIAVLEQLLQNAKRTIFITTVQGYEGAGRGFAIRFSKRLDTLAPSWLYINPTQPIRWQKNDPVEAFINDAFLLGIESPDLSVHSSLNPNDALVTQVDSSELLKNDALLKDLYSLLTQAHYQTTPADLQNILDSKTLLVFVQHTNQVLTGAALVAIEGTIPTELHQPIVEKRRRLDDQVTPQLLAQSAGLGNALSLVYARIVRIAINPAIQNQGFGTHLYQNIDRLLEDEVDCVAASFGADNATLSFWLKLGLKPIHYGLKINPRSGLRSVCLIRANHEDIRALVTRANRLLHTNSQAFLHNRLDKDTVLEKVLCASEPHAHNLDSLKPLIIAFQHGHRSFLDTAGLLMQYETDTMDSDLSREVIQTLATFAQMAPAVRRKQEAYIRSLINL